MWPSCRCHVPAYALWQPTRPRVCSLQGSPAQGGHWLPDHRVQRVEWGRTGQRVTPWSPLLPTHSGLPCHSAPSPRGRTALCVRPAAAGAHLPPSPPHYVVGARITTFSGAETKAGEVSRGRFVAPEPAGRSGQNSQGSPPPAEPPSVSRPQGPWFLRTSACSLSPSRYARHRAASRCLLGPWAPLSSAGH